MEPLVSIIVPVYNVENYIEECINSLIEQSYKNIEIILVDDGSKDQSGVICDQYKETDNRIIVLHKENGGLSDARNAGIVISQGEYIAFVDSDDYVSPFFVEILINCAVTNNVDVVALVGGVDFWDGDIQPAMAKNGNDYIVQRVSASKGLYKMLYQEIATGAPFKFCKSYMFSDLRFPVGYLYEDVATTYKLFAMTDDVMILNSRIYAYRKRTNSIIRREFNEDKLIVVRIAEQLIQDFSEYDLKIRKAAVSRAFSILFSVFLQVPKENKEYKVLLWNEIKKYRKCVLLDSSRTMRRKNKFAALVAYAGMEISHYLGLKFGRKESFKILAKEMCEK